MSKKRTAVLACVALLLAIGVPGAWLTAREVSFADQSRIDRPVTDLLVPNTGLPGAWTLLPHDPSPPHETWVTEEDGRVWDGSNGEKVGETVFKTVSPAFADWVFHRWNPPDPKPWKRTYKVTYVRPHELPRADAVQYTCAQYEKDSPCDHWQVTLRYGQYIVLVDVQPVSDSDPGSVGNIPDWLYSVVRDADRVIANQAPK